jgi:hypothetical protein
MTREEAIDRMVELDVAKWGEGERQASRSLRSSQYPTVGLALNGLAYFDPANINDGLAAEAKKLLTAADWRVLKRGG